MKRRFSWQLGYLIPRIVVLAMLADGACRLLPLSAIAFRGWETLFAPSALIGWFRPNAYYHNRSSYGDLAALSNRRWLRQYRDECFTTDALGCRNCPAPARQQPPDVLMVGSSFSVGTGVTDRETLAVQLESFTGKRVYNAGGFYLDVPRIRRMARLLGMQGGLVIAEYLERYDIPSGPFAPISESDLSANTALGTPQHWPTRLKASLGNSRLQILAQRLYKMIENDWLLPNAYAPAAAASTLRNGATMLFVPDDIDNHRRQRPVDHAAAYFSWLATELRRENLDLLVVLVPDKYTVYGPLLQDQDVLPENANLYLERLAAALRPTGIPLVNLTPVFRRQANDLLDRGEYLYWRDDTHWNATGIGVAAKEVADAWQQRDKLPR